jgi:hypothetical protein
VIFLWKSGSKLMAKNGSILLAIDKYPKKSPQHPAAQVDER